MDEKLNNPDENLENKPDENDQNSENEPADLSNPAESQNEPTAFSNPDESEKESKVLTDLADFDEMDETQFGGDGVSSSFEFFQDLQMNVYIELGRTNMQIRDILELERGYVIELDKLASEPVDIFVNNKKIAEGEVVVIDKHFGIRITNLSSSADTLKGLYQ